MKIRSRLLTKFVGWLVALMFRSLSRTLRLRGLVRNRLYRLLGRNPPRLHLRPVARFDLDSAGRGRRSNGPPVAALVSRHQDGAYLAEFMHYIGIRSIRGSTARGGDQALRELMRLGDDWHIFITPDGPRGPHHVIKSGLIYLASRTGRPIVPMVSHFDSTWHIHGNWTGLLIPKPFSRGCYLFGEPLTIPPDLRTSKLSSIGTASSRRWTESNRSWPASSAAQESAESSAASRLIAHVVRGAAGVDARPYWR